MIPVTVSTRRRRSRSRRRSGGRAAAVFVLALGLALIAGGAIPAPARAQADHRIDVRAPAPGHTAAARFCASPEGYARTAVLTVPTAAGPALAPEHGLRFTLRDGHDTVLADELSADELRRTRIDLGRFGADESVCVSLVARTPTRADDSFRTAAAEVALRVGSEGLVPGGLLAATGLNGEFTILVVTTGAVLVLVAGLLLGGGGRRSARLLGIAASLCGIALVSALAAPSWAMFTDAAAVEVTASGQFGVAIRDAGGKVRQSADRSVTYAYSDSGDFVPGNTAVLTLAVFNNSVAADGRFTLRITGTGTLAPFVRYSVSMDAAESSTVVVTGTPDEPAAGAAMPGDALRADLGVVPPAGVRLADGDAVPASAVGSVRTLTVKVHLLDDPHLRGLSGGAFDLGIQVIGESL